MLQGLHYQNAYVTRDLDRAVERLRAIGDIRQEAMYDGATEVTMRGRRGMMHNRIAFLWVGALQYELIEPVDGLVDLYREALPEDGSLRFHHVCMRVDDWASFRPAVDRQDFPVVLEGEAGPLRFLYLDARPVLGHYLEYTSMPEEMWSASGGL